MFPPEPASSQPSDSSAAFKVLPTWPVFPAFTADALSHQLSLSRVTDNSEWIGAIGVFRPVVEFRDHELRLQFGAGATVFSRLIKTPGHITVSTIDYKLDLPVDVRVGPFALRVGYGHISAHYADDGIERLGKKSISSVKDYVAVYAAYDVAPVRGYVYGGLQYSYHHEPEGGKPVQLQMGSELGHVALFSFLTLYGAVDIKVKQDVAWATTRSYQLGLRLSSSDTYAVRLAYTVRAGHEERGQVYDQSVTNHLVGLFVDV